MLDPVVIALAGAVSSIAAILFRVLQQQAQKAEEAEVYWRDKALASMGLAQIAVEEAERKARK